MGIQAVNLRPWMQLDPFGALFCHDLRVFTMFTSSWPANAMLLGLIYLWIGLGGCLSRWYSEIECSPQM